MTIRYKYFWAVVILLIAGMIVAIVFPARPGRPIGEPHRLTKVP